MTIPELMDKNQEREYKIITTTRQKKKNPSSTQEQLAPPPPLPPPPATAAATEEVVVKKRRGGGKRKKSDKSPAPSNQKRQKKITLIVPAEVFKQVKNEVKNDEVKDDEVKNEEMHEIDQSTPVMLTAASGSSGGVSTVTDDGSEEEDSSSPNTVTSNNISSATGLPIMKKPGELDDQRGEFETRKSIITSSIPFPITTTPSTTPSTATTTMRKPPSSTSISTNRYEYAGGGGGKGGGKKYQIDHNNENCNVCGGDGQFVCCETCPASFHFLCCDPPLNVGEPLPEGDWLCTECQDTLKKNAAAAAAAAVAVAMENNTTDLMEEQGIWQRLTKTFKAKNPQMFRLSKDILTSVTENLAINEQGDLVDWTIQRPFSRTPQNIINTTATSMNSLNTINLTTGGGKRGGNKEEEDLSGWTDSKGRWRLCYWCRRTAYHGPMLSCSFCSLHWHLDCLILPTMTNPPSFQKRWKCPAHVEHVTTSKRKYQKTGGQVDNEEIMMAEEAPLDATYEIINDVKDKIPIPPPLKPLTTLAPPRIQSGGGGGRRMVKESSIRKLFIKKIIKACSSKRE